MSQNWSPRGGTGAEHIRKITHIPDTDCLASAIHIYM